MRLFIFCLIILSASAVYAQGFKLGQAAPNVMLDNLVQGRLSVGGYAPIRGSQFLEPIWLPGEVTYLENNYQDLLLSYDIYQDLIIVWRQLGQKIQLNNQYVTQFKLEDRYFINLKYSAYQESGLKEGFYQVLFEDQLKLLVKRQLQVEADGPQSVFYRADQWFLIKNGQAIHIRNKKSLLAAFDEVHRKPIKRFLRSRYINLQRAKDQEWLLLIKFLNELPQSG